MRPRSFLAAMLAVLLAATLAGCGIPDETGVRVEGSGPARGDGREPGAAVKPPDRLAARDDATFVANYLLAAAGEIGGAYERVKEYIAPHPINKGDLRESQGPEETGINIVRLTEPISVNHRQDNTRAVTIKVQQVGVLRADGAVHPPELTDTSYELLVGPIDVNDIAGQSRRDQLQSGGLWVIDPPPVLLMSEQALESYYEPHTIYFWSKDRQALVADLRHLPLAVPESRRADELVGWLTRGPSWLLADAVATLPAGTQKIGNVTQDGQRLVVNLATDLGPDPEVELDKLGTQLVWSLGEYSAAELEIKIKDESREIIPTAARREDWPVYPVNAPQRFAVYDGAIHSLKNSSAAQGDSDEEATPAPVPLVGPAKRNITAAAFTSRSEGVWAALVARSGETRWLLVGTGVDAIKTFDQSKPFAQMSRPIWLRSRSNDPDGLIVADGQLYRFGPGASLTPVPLAGHRTVTAVAAALDGHRIAFITDGELYVAALTVSGDTVKVHRERRLHTRLNRLTAVEWIGENRLVVAGFASDGQVALYDIDDDSGRESIRDWQRGTEEITHLAAYARNPLLPNEWVKVMYELNGVAWDDATRTRLGAEHVEGLPDSPEHEGFLTAPFFVY